MNEDTVTANWKQFSCKIKEKQGKRTGDALKKAKNIQDYPLGTLQAYYYRLAEQHLKDLGHA